MANGVSAMGKKVSVIIPAYNAEKYIIACLESVYHQTYKNIEVILVDDGSKDNTYTIASEYLYGKENSIVFKQENQGVCSARNKGIDLATGEYIMFLDSDDYMPDNAIESLYSDIVATNADLAVGRVCGENDKNKYPDRLTAVWRGKESLIEELDDNPLLYGCVSKLFKRSFVGDIRFVVGRKAHEDGFFTFLVLLKQPTVSVRDQCTYVYRYNPESASHAAFSEKYFDVLYFDQLVRDKICEKYPEFIEKTYNQQVRTNLTMLNLFCRTKDKKYNKDVKASIKTVRKYGKYFIPVLKGEKRFFRIVKYGGYWLYRRLFWIKYRKQM